MGGTTPLLKDNKMAIPSWITLSKLSGAGNDTVTITAEENVSTVPRSGAITIRAGSISKVITVTQEGAGATKGKITFRYTGAQIPQEYVGYHFYIGIGTIITEFAEFYADYGEIESITADTVVVNIDNLEESNINTIVSIIENDMTDKDEVYFGISSSDDPSSEWVPLLSTTDSGGESYTSGNMAVIIQNAFYGADEAISAKSLITPSREDINCSWGISAANLLLASITQETLNQAAVPGVDFTVYVDIYPDGERRNDSSMLNIQVGEFTLGLSSGESLNQPVVVKTNTNSQFVWVKDWSTVALCRFTIKCDFGNVLTTMSNNLIVNGVTFTKHEEPQAVYFESLEGIPLQYKTNQTLEISSNYPTLTFDTLA